MACQLQPTSWIATINDIEKAVAALAVAALADQPASQKETTTMNVDALDARRYRRLRILGCAPMTSINLDEGTVLRFTNLDVFLDTDIKREPSRGEAMPASPAPVTETTAERPPYGRPFERWQTFRRRVRASETGDE